MKTAISYEAAKSASVEYFDGDEMAADVFLSKYALRDLDGNLLESTPNDMHYRLAKELARIEDNYINGMSEGEILDLIGEYKRVVLQGSPSAVIGDKHRIQSVSNCTVVPSPYDSYGGILEADQNLAQLMKRRCGVGIDISPIRPKNALTTNAAQTTDGIGVFMERYSNTTREVAQNGRRGALMISCDVRHPEIETFINIKRDDKLVTGANVSVRVTDDFMEAVIKDEDFQLQWPVDSSEPSIVKVVKAKSIWDKIINAAWERAEPGVLFWDRILKGPADIFADQGFETISTNPCFHYDTLVAVADGRQAVSIGDLAKEGRDVPVYSVDPVTGDVSIKMGRNPRVTGYAQKLLRVNLDDGSYLDVTPNHNFLLKDGTKVQAKDLKKGDSLPRFTKRLEKISKNNKDPYFRVFTNIKNSDKKVMEHRLISQFHDQESWNNKKTYAEEVGFTKTGGIVVHHKDYDQLNNRPENLEVMTFREHQQFHAEHDTSGDKNGRFSGFSNEEIIEHARILTAELGYRFSKKDWIEYAQRNGLPLTFSSYRKAEFGTLMDLSRSVAEEAGIQDLDIDPRLIRTLRDMESQGYEARIEGNQVLVKRNCETCGIEIEHEHRKREISYCSVSCANVKRFAKARGEELVSAYNHKVLSVEEIEGEHTVYNITVDDNHTVGIITSWDGEDVCKSNQSGIFTLQCGEIPLCAYDSCRLVFLNLLSYVKNPWTNNAKFDYETFMKDVRKGQRIMDDIVDIELECIQNIIDKIKSDPEPEHIKLSELRLWENMYDVCEKGRRTGLGITALGDALAALGLRYGSEDSITETRNIYKTLAVGAFTESVRLAGERGPFPVCDVERMKDHPFYQMLLAEVDQDTYDSFFRWGCRNISWTTTAPVGSMSTQTQTTSGIEPAFLVSYTRRKKMTADDRAQGKKPDLVDQNGDEWINYTVYHSPYKDWMNKTGETEYEKSPYFNASANDIDWVASVDIQAAAQEWVSHSISKTCNLPADVTQELVSEVYMRAWKTGCFVEGSLVYTKDGLKPIEKILVGDSVYSHDGKLHNVNKIFHLEPEERILVNIKPICGPEINVTSEHPIAVITPSLHQQNQKEFDSSKIQIEWKKAGDITTEDFVLYPDILDPKLGTVKSVNISDFVSDIIHDGEFVFPARRLPWKLTSVVKCANSSPVKDNIPLNKDFAEFLGWFIAEGHYNGKSCLRLNFNLNEFDVAEKLSVFVESTFKIPTEIFETNGNNGRSLRLQFHSVLISRFLERFIGRKSKNKHLPINYHLFDKEILERIIQCHFDGDAGVTTSRRLAYELFHARGLISNGAYFKSDYGQGFMVKSLNENGGPAQKRYGHFRTAKVFSVKKSLYHEKVYNLSVEDSDTYVVHGLAVHNCKGFTVYRDGCRTGVLVAEEKEEDFKSHNAPKRPTELPCDIFHVTYKGEKWVILIGLLNGRPYELFGGAAVNVSLPKKHKEGLLVKNPRKGNARYDLHIGEDDDEIIIRDVAQTFDDADQSAWTRLVSTALRHGTPVKFIVEQLQKEKDTSMFTFAKVMSRTLKTYIKDGEKMKGTCLNCGSEDLVYQEGCLSCQSCGSSKCG